MGVDHLQDLDMYYAETDTPAVARTSNLNEELGQVSLNLPSSDYLRQCIFIVIWFSFIF